MVLRCEINGSSREQLDIVEEFWKRGTKLRRLACSKKKVDDWQILRKNFALGRFGFIKKVCRNFGAAENVRKTLFPKQDADDDDRDNAEDSEQNCKRDFDLFR